MFRHTFGVTAEAPRPVLPGVRAVLVALRNRVEDPLHGARARIVSADVSRRRFPGPGPVRHRAADDDRVTHDRNRGRMPDTGAVDGTPERGAQIHDAVVAKARVKGAGPGMQDDQP